MNIRHRVAFLTIFIGIALGILFPACAQRPTVPPVSTRVPESNFQHNAYNVGLTIIDFDYITPRGKREVITTAVWYPTQEKPQLYTYRAERDYNSAVALNASSVAPGGPYPLVLYAHGAFGSGYSSAYFTEHLAKQGYIVIAPDYVDTKPPEYTEPVAFSRIKRGKSERTLQVLRMAKTWIADMGANRDFFLSYLAEHRLNHTSFLIDQMLALNRDGRSIFYQSIQADAIGMIGYSEGGATVIGKIGGHPDPQFKDARIRAALIFSAPVYPFENSLGNIHVPVMVMVEDGETPALGPNLPRRLLYDRTNIPKYYLVLKDADHFAFGNRTAGDAPFYQAVESNPKVNVICRYGLAFFQKYLKGDIRANAQLKTSAPPWVYYIKEEKSGEVAEWGREPEHRQEGSGGRGFFRRLRNR